MMGMMQLIDTKQLDKENQELFKLMLSEMKNSRNIIDQIAKYVDIQGMKFEYTKDNVIKIIEESIAKYNENNLNIMFIKSLTCEDHEVYIEGNILTLVLEELIVNAIKHSEGKIIEVDIDCEQKKDGGSYYYYIKVTDQGKGISKENLDYIFNEFYHHDFINIYREDEKVSLPMCKQMLLSSGGDLLVKSEVGKGCVFTIMLPTQSN
jgi:signal transduction histidine kinase